MAGQLFSESSEGERVDGPDIAGEVPHSEVEEIVSVLLKTLEPEVGIVVDEVGGDGGLVRGVKVIAFGDVGARAERDSQFRLDQLDRGGQVCALESEHVEGVNTLGGGDTEVHVGATEIDHVEVDDFGRFAVDVEDLEVEEIIGHVVERVVVVRVFVDFETHCAGECALVGRVREGLTDFSGLEHEASRGIEFHVSLLGCSDEVLTRFLSGELDC